MRERALTILADLIAFRTVSSEPNLDIAGHIAGLLKDCGARVTLSHDEAGGKANVFATIGPAVDGGVILSGHTDVVAATGNWSADPFVAVERQGRIHGRGSADMKGFLACALAAAPMFAAARLKRPVHFAFTYDEEVGCRGARVLIDALAREAMRPMICIVGEPTDMHVVDAHKGCFEYTTEFVGLSGHGSTPDRGVNAIHHAARFVAFLLDLAERLKARALATSPFDPPWTTIQVGRMSGGEARNIIAGHARVEWEFRPVNRADADLVLDAVDAYIAGTPLPAMRMTFPQAEVVTECIGEVAGLEPVATSPAAELVRRLNGGLTRAPVSFGTEAGLFQAAGISTVLCGPGSIAQAHTVDEFIEIDQIDKCLDMIGRLVAELERDR